MKHYYLLLLALPVAFLFACKGGEPKDSPQEDIEAKNTAQGIWVDEIEGDIVFQLKDDTVYYPDNEGEPAAFYIAGDSLFLKTSHPVRYKISQLTANALRLMTTDGDEINLLRSTNEADTERFGQEKKADEQRESAINQGQLIKRDSVLTADGVRYHAYVQVNPTRFKVLKQSVNDNGIEIENAFYDNIVHISLYEGATSLYSHDFRKEDFAEIVPKEYLQQSVLSDILIKNATAEGVVLEAIIAEPEAYTSYHIVLTISHDGKVKLEEG